MDLNNVLKLKTPDDLWKYMDKNIKYGWTNKKGEFREYKDSRMKEEYYYHSPKETVERKSGLCGDQVLLEKAWFDYHNIKNHIVTFGFLNESSQRIGGGHIFLIYEENNKYYYFENAFKACANILEYNSFNEALGDAIALYLLCTNSKDKVNKIYITIDGHIKENNNTEEDYIDTLNDQDLSSEYLEYVKNGLEKYKELI